MKRYLVPFEGSNLSKSALRYAIQFARGVPGVIDIIYIADERMLSNALFDLTILALQGIGTLGNYLPREKAKLELKAKLLARGEEILDELKSWPELAEDAPDPVQHNLIVESGNPPKLLSEKSEIYDIIFMGLWGEMHKLKAGLWGGTSETVIRRGTCPVFLATDEYEPFDSIIVGFDNRPRSRQALAWAAMVGENMSIPVTVITSGNDKDWRDEVIAEAGEINASFDTEFNYIQTDDHPAKAVLMASSVNPTALICLGAFGDQPIRELFLGSVAEEVLRHSESPVFLLK